MPQHNQNVEMVSTTRTQYNLLTKDENTLYFVLETTGEISLYLGTNLINDKWLAGASVYTEDVLATIDTAQSVDTSLFDGYKLIRAELFADNVFTGTGEFEIISKVFKPLDLQRLSKTEKMWASSNETAWGVNYQAYDNISAMDVQYLIDYLNSNYPASGQNVGDMARGNDGGLPVTYFYAIVTETTTIRNAKISIGTGKLETSSATTLLFTAPVNAGITFKLRLIGVDW